jgi:hypothetical protein
MLAPARQGLASQPVLLLALAWAGTRLVLIAQLVAFPDAFMGDVRLYALWSQVLFAGQFPIGDPFWQYPPGAGLLFAGLGALGPQPVWAFVCLALLADGSILAMLCRAIQRQPTPSRSWWAPGAWVVGGLAIGPVMLARFDLFPTAFAVAAILLVSRPAASGALAGVGGLLKAWPILVLVAVPRARLLRAGLAALAVAVIGAVSISAWAPGSTAFLGEQRARGLQVESVGALPYAVAGALGFDPDIVLRFGAFEVEAPGVGAIGLGLTALGAALLALLVVGRLLGRLESAPGGDVALLAVLISVATSRVLSPQYSVWLVGVAVAAACSLQSGARPATRLLIAMAAVTQVLFPWGYGSYLDTAPYAVGLQAIRLALLILATAWACKAILNSLRTSPGLSAR